MVAVASFLLFLYEVFTRHTVEGYPGALQWLQSFQKNKMEKQTPIPLKTKMKPRERQNAPFPFLIYRAGRGGLKFSPISFKTS